MNRVQRLAVEIVFCFVVVVCIGWCTSESKHTDGTVRPSEVVAEGGRMGEHLPWQDLPFDPARYGSMPDSIPDLRPLAIDVVAASDLSSPNHRLLMERLKVVVAQNFVPEVANELDQLMRSYVVHYVMEPSMKGSATFSVKDGTPRISVNAQKLARLNGRTDVAGYMLVIAHEFVHYKQWRDARDPVTRRSFDEDGSKRLDPKICGLVWQNERAAYKRQCELGNSIGIAWHVSDDPRKDYCARVNSDPAFDQAFYRVQVTVMDPDTVRECRETWWDLAGGPRRTD